VTGPPPPPPRYGRLFWGLLPAGGVLMAWGLVGLLPDAASTVPASWLRWFLGGLLAHDLLLVPAVLIVGLALRRLPPALQPPERFALIVSGTLALMERAAAARLRPLDPARQRLRPSRRLSPEPCHQRRRGLGGRGGLGAAPPARPPRTLSVADRNRVL
jgi:hypothetical protein